jgi:hypothetical protein
MILMLIKKSTSQTRTGKCLETMLTFMEIVLGHLGISLIQWPKSIREKQNLGITIQLKRFSCNLKKIKRVKLAVLKDF